MNINNLSLKSQNIKFLSALVLMLRHCSAVNTSPARRSLGEGGLKDFFERSRNILRQAQDERGIKISLGISSNKIVAYCLLINVIATHAMLTIQDVPHLSLDCIGACIEKLPHTESHQIKKQLSDSFTFNIALLPEELRYTIVMNMFDDEKELAELYHKAPLISACTHLHEARKAAIISSASKEKQEELAIQLFGLPAHPKKIISNVINPSFTTRLAHSGPVISLDTLATLDQDVRNKIFKDLDIALVQKFEEDNPLTTYLFNCTLITSMCSVGSSVAIQLIPFLTCSILSSCPDLSSVPSFVSTAALSAVPWGGIVAYLIRKRDKLKKIAIST